MTAVLQLVHSLPDPDDDPVEPVALCEWRRKANCLGLDPALFFPERGQPTNELKQICAGCVVRAECLDYALEAGEKYGMWGGVSERGRRSIRKVRTRQQRDTAIASIPPLGLIRNSDPSAFTITFADLDDLDPTLADEYAAAFDDLDDGFDDAN